MKTLDVKYFELRWLLRAKPVCMGSSKVYGLNWLKLMDKIDN